MNTIIYAHYHKELDKDIGHLDDKGVVYSHSVKEVGYAIGRVDDKGIVRTHPTATFDYDVGRVTPDGKIYDHSALTVGHCIGHVDENGVIYSHSNSELGYEIGHVSGPLKKRAAAAYMLLMQQGQTPPPQEAAPPTREEPQPVKREEPVQSAPQRSTSTSGGGGGCGGFIGFLVIVLALGFVKGLWELAVKYPGMIWMIALIVIISTVFKPPRGVSPADLQVSEPGREQCKQQAKSTAIKYSLVPLAMAAYTLYKNGMDFTAILFSTVPLLTTYFAIHRVAYVRNLVQAQEDERSGKQRNYTQPKPSASQSAPKAAAAAPQPKATASAPASEKVIAVCPGCSAKCRVPSGKGRIKIKCPGCGRQFETTT